MWDFSIQSDHVIEVRRPDLIVVDKKGRTCKIIDFAVPGDSRIEEKEKEKIECESEDYTIRYGLFRCYTETVR